MEMYETKRLVEKRSYGEYEEEPRVRHKTYSVDSPKCRKWFRIGLCVIAILLTIALIILIGVILGRKRTGSSSNRQEICSNPPVLLISLDGFWSGYLKRNLTPFIQSLADTGVTADYMRSEFPTETFPNHFSIVTGLHPESHGIVNNKFYDSVLKKNFTIKKTQREKEWWLAKPIWVTTTKNGMKSGVYFWPGSEVEGIQPTYFKKYDIAIPFDERISTILDWLDLPKATRPQFIAAYFNQPDNNAHKKGPNSENVNSTLSQVDKTVQSLFDGLKERKVEDCVNVIITSDHGMTTYNSSKLVILNDHLPAPKVIVVNGVAADIFVPQEGGNTSVNETYQSLAQYSKTGQPFRAYLSEDLPLRLHSGHFNKQRYGDIYLIGDEGSYIMRGDSNYDNNGTHGYDSILSDMQAIFIGHGPAFRKGYVSEAFANIELYNLMCGLLGIPPSPNNGTVGSLYHMLTPSLLPTLPPPQAFQGSEGVRDSCPYPTDEDTYNMRSFCDECVCRNQTECADVSNTTINESNMLLNPTAEQIKEDQNLHLPWGVPSGGEGSSSCLLTQQDYVTLYSNTLHIPLWSAFKLTREQGNISQSSGGCLRRDPRIPPPNSSNCTYYATEGGEEFVAVRLAAALSTSSTAQQLTTNLLSNVVPQMTKFNTRVWLPLEDMLRSWAINFSTIHIILGSVLDVNRDGERDNDADYTRWVGGSRGVAIPSHFYAIVVRCKSEGMEPADCKANQLDALGLLFQHPTADGDPSPTSKLLRYALTPIRDIERVTGVSFFPALKVEDKNALELRITNQLWTDV